MGARGRDRVAAHDRPAERATHLTGTRVCAGEPWRGRGDRVVADDDAAGSDVGVRVETARVSRRVAHAVGHADRVADEPAIADRRGDVAADVDAAGDRPHIDGVRQRRRQRRRVVADRAVDHREGAALDEDPARIGVCGRSGRPRRTTLSSTEVRTSDQGAQPALDPAGLGVARQARRAGCGTGPVVTHRRVGEGQVPPAVDPAAGSERERAGAVRAGRQARRHGLASEQRGCR